MVEAGLTGRQRAVLDQVRVNAPGVMLAQGLLDTFLARRIHPEVGLDFRVLTGMSEGEVAAMARRMEEAGLRPSAHGPFLDLSPGALDPDILKTTRERYARSLELAALFQPEHIVFHAFYERRRHLTYREKWLEVSLETWRPLAVRARRLGIRLVLENVYEEGPEEIEPLLSALAPEGVGLCFDIGHAVSFGRSDPLKWLEALWPCLAVLHLHDNNGEFDQHLGLGRGTIDFPAFFSWLAEHGVRPAAVTLEPHQEDQLWVSVAELADLWPWPLEE
ncbi:MAG: sugar phosphate isomerase/epimerase family protein [Pseudomonadota bacterium]